MRTSTWVGIGAMQPQPNEPVIKELHLIEDRRWWCRRIWNNVEEIVDYDFRNAHIGVHLRPNSKTYKDNFYNIEVWKNHVTAHVGISDPLAGRHMGFNFHNYTGPYPKLIYLAVGEAETPESELKAKPGVRPDWIRVESAEDRAAREKKENLVDYKRIAHNLARHQYEDDLIPILANAYAKRKYPNPHVFIQTLGNQIGTDSTLMELVVDVVNVHRLKLIGLLWRLIKLYEDSANAVPFQLSRDTEWETGNTYKIGDYEKHDNFTWWCLAGHTATDANAPGSDDTVWRKVLLNSIPSTFSFNVITYEAIKDPEDDRFTIGHERKKATKNVTINVETGDGILDYIRMLTHEFKYHKDFDYTHESIPSHVANEHEKIPSDNLFFFAGILKKHAEWKKKIDKFELWTSKLESSDPIVIVPDFKIYQSKVAVIDNRNANQVSDAKELTETDWTDLFENYFEALFHYASKDAKSPWQRSPGM